MGIVARKLAVDISGATATVDKEMANARRSCCGLSYAMRRKENHGAPPFSSKGR
jgi:hypothetical protein